MLVIGAKPYMVMFNGHRYDFTWKILKKQEQFFKKFSISRNHTEIFSENYFQCLPINQQIVCSVVLITDTDLGSWSCSYIFA